MDTFGEYNGLFETLGLNGDAATVAAMARYRSKTEARSEYLAGEAAELADQLKAEAQHRSRATAQEIAQVTASVPTVVENAIRGVPSLPLKPLPGQARTVLQPAAEAIVGQVREALRMTDSDARTFVGNLHDREARRGGADHARMFLASFAEGLAAPVSVREVAAR